MHRLMEMAFAAVLLFTAACGSAPATSQGPTITIEQPWVRAMSAMQVGISQGTPDAMGAGDMGHGGGFNSAAYMLLRNTGSQPDRLLAIKGDVANAIEIHQSEMKDGVMSMHPVDFIEVPAGGTAELKPGGYHVMLIDLKRDLVAGEKFTLTLVFEKGGEKPVEFEVREP
jgi:periplasmic copper chaperone A